MGHIKGLWYIMANYCSTSHSSSSSTDTAFFRCLTRDAIVSGSSLEVGELLFNDCPSYSTCSVSSCSSVSSRVSSLDAITRREDVDRPRRSLSTDLSLACDVGRCISGPLLKLLATFGEEDLLLAGDTPGGRTGPPGWSCRERLEGLNCPHLGHMYSTPNDDQHVCRTAHYVLQKKNYLRIVSISCGRTNPL